MQLAQAVVDHATGFGMPQEVMQVTANPIPSAAATTSQPGMAVQSSQPAGLNVEMRGQHDVGPLPSSAYVSSSVPTDLTGVPNYFWVFCLRMFVSHHVVLAHWHPP